MQQGKTPPSGTTSQTWPLPRYGPPLTDAETSGDTNKDTADNAAFVGREAGAEFQESGPIAAVALEATPAVPASGKVEDYASSLSRVLKSSGIYAIASMAGPLISLVMMPYIAHHMSRSDYGLLTLLNTAISLTAGITALGLGSAFFRTYNYEFPDPDDRRSILATVTALLVAQTVPIALLFVVFSGPIATLLLGDASAGRYIALAAGVVIAQNLTIPGLSWMRAETRAPSYVVLALINLLVTLGATVALVGPLNMGIAGALIGNGVGFAALDIVVLPFVLLRGRLYLRRDMAWRLVSFGAPQVLSMISYWFLQVSDRYLLAAFTTLAEVARYAAAYTLGSVIGTLVISPFQLAWASVVFQIAKQPNCDRIYAHIFRYYGMLLLYGAFGMAIVGQFALKILFPQGYANAAPVIPPVALAVAIYGLYNYFMLGTAIRRVLWMAPVFVTVAALVNVGINLALIPRYGSMGAAAATLVAYIILAGVAYIGNQRIYPVPYARLPLVLAVVLGVGLLYATNTLTPLVGARWQLPLDVGALIVYALCLVPLAFGRGTLRLHRLIARLRRPALNKGGLSRG